MKPKIRWSTIILIFAGTKKPMIKLLKPLEKSFVKKDTLQPFEKGITLFIW